MSSFKLNRTEDSLFKYDPKMLSVRQLDKAIDSLGDVNASALARTKKELAPNFEFVKFADSSWPPANQMKLKKIKSFNEYIPDSLKTDVYNRSLTVLPAHKA